MESEVEVDLYYDEDDVTMNPKLMELTFHEDLVQGKLNYLEELKDLALNDYELEEEGSKLIDAFRLMIAFIGSDCSTAVIEKIQLKHWLEFGLDQSTINRLGYLAYQRRKSREDDDLEAVHNQVIT